MATDAARLGRTRSGERSKEKDALANESGPAIQRAWEEPAGLRGALTTVQSVRIGRRLIAVSFLFLLLGGINAALIRFQLAQPNNTLVAPEQYNQLFTMHGTTMIFFFAVPFVIGTAFALLPPMLGARAMPWPRLAAFVFWTFTIGGLLFQASWLLGTVPDAGWTANPLLAEKGYSPGLGLDFWLFAILMVSVGAIFGSVVLIVTVLKARAPGMSMNRMPLFGWAVLVMGATLLVAFIILFCAGVQLLFERKFGTDLYNPAAGGSPLLWQRLFWIIENPDLYLLFIPGAGMISAILPAILRQRIVGYAYLVAALVLTGVMSLGLWVVHLFVTDLPTQFTLFAGVSLLVVIPIGMQAAAWLATMRQGAGKWNTAYLFILGFLFLLVVGVLTGVLITLVTFSAQLQGSFFVVAHLHYVIFGTLVFPIFAGVYYWFPKFFGGLLDERLGQLNFWLMFLGFNMAFFLMFISGLLGMARRLYTYPSIPELDRLNLFSTVGAVVLVLGIMVFLINVIKSLRRSYSATANPWGSDSLEWATDSPVPTYGFHRIPIVSSRHPLWDQEQLNQKNEKSVRLVERLAEWPDTWRAALTTNTLTGEPEELYGVAGPSIWPLIAVMGMTLIFVSFFFEQLVLLAVFLLGAVILVAGLVGWHWRKGPAEVISKAELDEFEQSYGTSLYTHGSPGLARWAVLLTAFGMGIGLVVFVLSDWFLRLNSSTWLPDGVARPDRSVPWIATGVLVLSEIALLLTARSEHRDANRAHRQLSIFKFGQGTAFLLGIAFLVLQVRSYILPPLTPTSNAYGTIFYSIGFVMTLMAVIGLVILLRGLWLAWRGKDERRPASLAGDALAYWSFVAAAWLVTLATLYLTV